MRRAGPELSLPLPAGTAAIAVHDGDRCVVEIDPEAIGGLDILAGEEGERFGWVDVRSGQLEVSAGAERLARLVRCDGRYRVGASRRGKRLRLSLALARHEDPVDRAPLDPARLITLLGAHLADAGVEAFERRLRLVRRGRLGERRSGADGAGIELIFGERLKAIALHPSWPHGLPEGLIFGMDRAETLARLGPPATERPHFSRHRRDRHELRALYHDGRLQQVVLSHRMA